jgi:hypothetical protein
MRSKLCLNYPDTSVLLLFLNMRVCGKYLETIHVVSPPVIYSSRYVIILFHLIVTE